jgi:hypothetical protein
MVTEYGGEFEVCGHTVFSTERPHVMHAQAKGKVTPDTPVRYVFLGFDRALTLSEDLLLFIYYSHRYSFIMIN